MPKNILIIIGVLVTVALGAFIFILQNKVTINSYEECVAAGYPIMESYPEQCKTPDSRTFVRVIAQKELAFGTQATLAVNESVKFNDGLSVTLLEINDSRCKSGVVCIWAGELSFKFNIIGGNVGDSKQEFRLGTTAKNTIAISGYSFILNSATEGTVTITVAKQNEQVGCTMEAKICPDGSAVGRTGPNCEFASCPANSQGSCYIGGCSSQICSDKEGVSSTCVYREEYVCYKTAKCERQINGQCAWTETSELKECLSSK